MENRSDKMIYGASGRGSIIVMPAQISSTCITRSWAQSRFKSLHIKRQRRGKVTNLAFFNFKVPLHSIEPEHL